MAQVYELEDALATTDLLSDALNCSSEDATSCLRSKAPSELVDATAELARQGLRLPHPTIDGARVPEAPLDVLESGRGANVPVVLGSNTNEGTFFVYGAGAEDVPLDDVAYRVALSKLLLSDAYLAEALELYPASGDDNRPALSRARSRRPLSLPWMSRPRDERVVLRL